MEIDVVAPLVYNVAAATNNYDIRQVAGATALIVPTPGPPGPRGAAGGSIFTYTQSTPAATWTVSHNLGRFPASVTVWIGDEEVSTDIDTPDTSTAVITFSSPQSGRAELI